MHICYVYKYIYNIQVDSPGFTRVRKQYDYKINKQFLYTGNMFTFESK